ncbi:MAG: c-type cytochrome [Magnetococcales bacterium]|nr:c-type cytochrome [Magnetococcales bacterium]
MPIQKEPFTQKKQINYLILFGFFLLLFGCQASPYSTGDLINLASESVELHNDTKAEKYYQQALEQQPDNPFALYNLSLLYRRNKRFADEEAILNRLFGSDMFPNGNLEQDSEEDARRRARGLSPLRDFIMAQWMTKGDYRESALALRPDLKRGRDVYFQYCSEKCHQPDGWGTPDGKIPQIAGQHRTVQVKQLADIAAKNRDNPTMFRFSLPNEVGGYQAISDVSAYIATLPMNPQNGHGPGTNLKHGKKIFHDYCRSCHGDHGEGKPDDYYPLLQGQHYEYMLRQITWMKNGKRRAIHPLKMKQIKYLAEGDMLAALDYVSRHSPPSVLVARPGWKNPDLLGREKHDAPTEKMDGEGLF